MSVHADHNNVIDLQVIQFLNTSMCGIRVHYQKSVLLTCPQFFWFIHNLFSPIKKYGTFNAVHNTLLKLAVWYSIKWRVSVLADNTVM